MSAGPPPHAEQVAAHTARSGPNLLLRVGSALVLAPLALITAYIGGWWFAFFWGLAAIGLYVEWSCLIAGRLHGPLALAGGSALAIATVLAGSDRLGAALIVLALGAAGAAVAAPDRRPWAAAGVAYGGALVMAPIALRHDAEHGWPALLLLFAVVWATDIAGYFAGRAFGGAKLWPRVSPNKTWAGAIAGVVASMVLGLLVAEFTGTSALFPIACVALPLSICSQGGDLFESAIKRRFGAKDASHVIPGHGGLMDRLDGFVAAALLALLLGLWRGGVAAPARGLMVW